MAKKADLLAEAAKLKLDVTEKNTIAEIEAAIAGAAPAEEVAEAPKEETATAKAGKRSEKALA
ncbi:MAG TPA: 50S ribosomal protein L1, partial [Candidatus Saccharimonadales bacterium]